jgi:hypothetical protein
VKLPCATHLIVTGATQELLEQKVKPALTAFLSPRGLELSEQKTVITHISKGFNFLGHTVRKFGDKLLTSPAKSNVQALRAKISLCIKSALGLPQEALLLKLNPLIRGWANYFRHGASKRTFDRLDYHVFWQLVRWANRRHPNKSANWKRRKYFTAAGKRGLFSVRLNKAGSPSRAPLTTTAHTVQRGKRFDAPRKTVANSNRQTLVGRRRRVPTQTSTGWRGLSRMKGNFHVRFLGGCGRATARTYPIFASSARTNISSKCLTKAEART